MIQEATGEGASMHGAQKASALRHADECLQAEKVDPHAPPTVLPSAALLGGLADEAFNLVAAPRSITSASRRRSRK